MVTYFHRSHSENIALSALDLASELIRCESLTENSNHKISGLMFDHLDRLEFEVEILDYQDQSGVDKRALAAVRNCSSAPAQHAGIGYFCHNDVVSVDSWNCAHSGPFDARVHEGRLWGRGSCDMKGSTACALTAIEQFPVSEQLGPIFFFVTGDEESGMLGAEVVAAQSNIYATMVSSGAAGIVGEPTELQVVNAHKGVCHIELETTGVAAHSSTQDGLNANWKLIPMLSYLGELNERCNSDPALKNDLFSPATQSVNVVIENVPASPNITVGSSKCKVFFRPMPNTSWRDLVEEIQAEAQKHDVQCKVLRALAPVHTPQENSFITEVLGLRGQSSPLSVCFATDGCCFNDLENLVVLGPGSIEQAHRPDEWISLEQLELGVDVFSQLFRRFA